MSSPLVLVSSPLFERERVIRGLQAGGCRTGLLPDSLTEDDAALLAEASGVIVSPECRLDEGRVEIARQLRIAASPVIGTDHIAVDALTRRRILVVNGAHAVNFAGMAEAVVGLITALLHRFKSKEGALQRGQPLDGPPGQLIMGRTVGLIGGGRIGQAVIERLQGWQCRILVADPGFSAERAQRLGVESVGLLDALAGADVVSIQVPLTEHTRGLLGAAELARMRDGAHLINVGRGGVVDEAALYEELRSGRLAGAAMDVWAEEPPATDHPLLTLGDRVIATPHNVGHTIDAYHRLADLVVEQVLLGLAGERPHHLVNPEVVPPKP